MKRMKYAVGYESTQVLHKLNNSLADKTQLINLLHPPWSLGGG